MSTGRNAVVVPVDVVVPLSTHTHEHPPIANRRNKIELNRSFQGFFEFLNQSNFLATAVEFMTRPPVEVFSNLWFVKWVNAPIAIVTNTALGIIAIRNAHLKKDAFSIANAAVVGATSLALIVGAIGVAAGFAAMTFVAPLLITASIFVKALWDLGTAIAFGIKAAITTDPDIKLAHRNKALGALVDGLAGSLLTSVMVAFVLVASPVVQTVLMGLSIAATAVGVVAAAAKFVMARRHAKVEENALLAIEEGRDSTCCINAKLEHNQTTHRPGTHSAPALQAVTPSTSDSDKM